MINKIKWTVAAVILIAANLAFWIIVDFKGLFTMLAVPVGMYALIVIPGLIMYFFEKKDERIN